MGRALEKPVFFFGDSIPLVPQLLDKATEGWHYLVKGSNLFHPVMQVSYSLLHLQCASVPCHMDWELARLYSREPVGDLSPRGITLDENKTVQGLLPALTQIELP